MSRYVPPKPDEHLSVVLDLAQATSTQAAAGMAACVLLARWIAAGPHEGFIDVPDLDATHATIVVDTPGIQTLTDAIFQAEWVVKTDGGKLAAPSPDLLRAIDPSGGKYALIYRDAMASTVYARDKQRLELVRRLPGGNRAERLPEYVRMLARPDEIMVVSSTSLLGTSRQADGSHKEAVERNVVAFALMAKSLVAGCYVAEGTIDKQSRPSPTGDRYGQIGYDLVFPEVTDLRAFVESFPKAMLRRPTECYGERQILTRARVVHPEEAACEYLAMGLAGMTGAEVRYIGKVGQESLTLQLLRCLPSAARIAQYLASRTRPEGKLLRFARAEAVTTGLPVDQIFEEVSATLHGNHRASWFYANDSKILVQEAEGQTGQPSGQDDHDPEEGANQEDDEMSETTEVNEATDGTEAGKPAEGKTNGGRPDPFEGFKLDPMGTSGERLLWLRIWIGVMVDRWLNYKAEQKAGGRWSSCKADPDLKAKYRESRTRAADGATAILRFAAREQFLAWFHAEVFQAAQCGYRDQAMTDRDQALFSTYLHEYWAEALRHTLLKLSASKSFRSRTTEQNGGLTT